MSLLNRILIITGAILIIGALGFIIYKQHEISERQIAIETQVVKQKELADNILRSQSEYATKEDLDKWIKANGVNLKTIQEDLDKVHAALTAANVVVINSSGQNYNNIPSSGTGSNNPNPTKDNDPYGYLHKTQLFDISEKFGNNSVPFGQVGFSAWQEKPWNINVPPREYKVTNVVGTDENQRVYVYNKFTIKINDKEYEVKINSANTKQEYPTAKFSFWNPKMFITTGAAASVTNLPVKANFNVGAGLNIMSYGKFKTSPDFQVLGVGAGYQFGKNEFVILVNPISYNIGKALPANIMSNTYLGPSLQVSVPNGTVYVGANISLNL